jgi:putative endonuclease
MGLAHPCVLCRDGRRRSGFRLAFPTFTKNAIVGLLPFGSDVTDKHPTRCHPEEVQAFATRRRADEGSMYSAPCLYFVYIMTNRSKTLYTGVTGHLEQRVFEHKEGIKGEFAACYRIDRLVYFERFGDIQSAIAREKQIKGLLRVKKIALIVAMNPEWKDLSAEWFVRHRYEPGA